MVYKEGHTYYGFINDNYTKVYSETKNALSHPTRFFHFIERPFKIWSYGVLYEAIIVNSEGDPSPFVIGNVQAVSFKATGTSQDYALVVDYIVSGQPYTHTYHNNARFGPGVINHPLSYDKEWEGPAAKTIIHTMHEINEIGLDSFKAKTTLRRRICLLRNIVKFESGLLQQETERASFFTNCLENRVFDVPLVGSRLLDCNFDDYNLVPLDADNNDRSLSPLLDTITQAENEIEMIRKERQQAKGTIQYYKDHLVSACITEGTTSIPFAQFEFCRTLQELTIAGSVKSIGSDAFNDSSLVTLTFLSPIAPTLVFGFPSSPGPNFKANILIPKGSRQNYQGGTGSFWNCLQDQIQETRDDAPDSASMNES